MTRWTNSIFGVLLGLKVSMVFCATCRWKIALKIGYHGCRLRQCVVDSQGPKGIFWVLFLHPKVLLASRKDFSALILVEDLDSPTSLSLPCYHSIDWTFWTNTWGLQTNQEYCTLALDVLGSFHLGWNSHRSLLYPRWGARGDSETRHEVWISRWGGALWTFCFRMGRDWRDEFSIVFLYRLSAQACSRSLSVTSVMDACSVKQMLGQPHFSRSQTLAGLHKTAWFASMLCSEMRLPPERVKFLSGRFGLRICRSFSWSKLSW